MDSEIQKEILKNLEDSLSDLLTPSEKNSKTEEKKNLGSEISVIFNNAKSFNSIDKTKFIYKNKPLQEQLNYMSNFISDDVFFYENYIVYYDLKPNTNYIEIDPREIWLDEHSFIPKKKNGRGRLNPKNDLITGDAIFDLKIKGDFIENVELQIISDQNYNIPFLKNNNEWILTTFTQKAPFLALNMPFIKFFIKVVNKQSNTSNKISYHYSTFIFNWNLKKQISLAKEITFNINDINFKNIKYDLGWIYLIR